ncbi:MAG TPA: hypothetical protein VF230_01925 [Acidimicrobiales bacterium]
MLRGLRRSLALPVTAAVLLGGACGSTDASGERGKDVTVLEEPAPPSSMADLAVVKENVADQVATVDDQYIDATALYSVRDGSKAVATLQISRFNDDARVDDFEFRNGFVSNLGGQRGVPLRIGKEQVLVTQGNLQRAAVWFRDDLVFVLTTREDFTKPRTLLRQAVNVGVAA